jgi:hypothetical protein
VIFISSAFRTSCFTGSRTLSFTVSEPVNVRFATFGTSRTEYSSGRTCFGSFPGVVAKSNGFSALKFGTRMKETRAGKRRREASIRPLNNAASFEQEAGGTVAVLSH